MSQELTNEDLEKLRVLFQEVVNEVRGIIADVRAELTLISKDVGACMESMERTIDRMDALQSHDTTVDTALTTKHPSDLEADRERAREEHDRRQTEWLESRRRWLLDLAPMYGMQYDPSRSSVSEEDFLREVHDRWHRSRCEEYQKKARRIQEDRDREMMWAASGRRMPTSTHPPHPNEGLVPSRSGGMHSGPVRWHRRQVFPWWG